MDFDWNDLPYFLALAETGTLSQAAARLGVNHSTAFRRVNAMEARLGVTLFERLPSGYVPTAAGEEALRHAREADAAVQAVLRTVAGRDVALSGEVRLTTAAKLATDYVPGCLAALAEAHPGIRVEVAVSDSDFDLNRRQADLALRVTDAPPEHLVGRRVTSLPWFVMGGRRYLERHGKPRGMEDLGSHRLIGSDAAFRRLPAFAWLHQRYPDACFAARASDLNTMAALSVAGLGLAVLPLDQVVPELVRLFPLEPSFPAELWLLTHPDLRALPRIRAVSQTLYDCLRADPRLAPPEGPP